MKIKFEENNFGEHLYILGRRKQRKEGGKQKILLEPNYCPAIPTCMTIMKTMSIDF